MCESGGQGIMVDIIVEFQTGTLGQKRVPKVSKYLPVEGLSTKSFISLTIKVFLKRFLNLYSAKRLAGNNCVR